MAEERPTSSPAHHPTLALNTKVEADFVSPLTAVRSALEILRDFPDLADDERQRFVQSALRGCARLEQGVEHLAETVYAAGQQTEARKPSDMPQADFDELQQRIRFHADIDTVEIDFSGFRFSNAKIVNGFYDVIDTAVEQTERTWYFLVNYRDCSVWPEAWIAFAHRGKKVNTGYSLGTVRYADYDTPPDQNRRDTHLGVSDPDFFDSRRAALARIEEMKKMKALRLL